MKIKYNINKILDLIMKNIKKNSLIIFGYSDVIILALVVNSKLDKVKEFNMHEDNNQDRFFMEISNFFPHRAFFHNVCYSCGPGGFTIIRRIISYVKALKFNYSPNTKFIGLSNLFILAVYLNSKYKTNDRKYILSILNYSKDNFVQIYQKRKNAYFFLESLSDIKNVEIDLIETYLETLNLSIQNVHSVYLGANPQSISFLNNVQLVDRSNLLKIITEIPDLIEKNKLSQTDCKHFSVEKFEPFYGKPPSTN